MSNQLEKVQELIALRAEARLGGGEKPSRNSTNAANTLPVNVLHSFWTKDRLKKLTCLYATAATTLARKRKASLVTAL